MMKLKDTVKDFLSCFPSSIEREPISFRDFLTFLIPGFFFLYFVFSTTIFIPYSFHDTNRYFRKDFSNPEFINNCKNDYQNQMLYLIGRPLTAELTCLVFKNTRTLEDLFVFRFAGLVFIGIALALLASWLAALNFGKWEAFFISSAIFTLPGIQRGVFMTNYHTIAPFALALISYFLLTPIKSPANNSDKKGFRLKYPFRLILAFLVLLASLYIYPINSFFFLIPTLCVLLFGRNIPWPSIRYRVVRDLLFLGTCCIVYFVSVRIYLALFFEEALKAFKSQGSSSYYNFGFDFDKLWSKLSLLYTHVKPLVFNFWNVDINNNLGSLLAAFVAVTLCLVIFVSKSKPLECSNLKFAVCGQNVQKVLAVFLIAFAVTTPWLFSSSRYVFFRIFSVAMAMALICLYWSVIFWLIPLFRKFLRQENFLTFGWALLLMLTGGLAANYTMIQNVWNSNTEHLFAQIAIAEQLNGPIRRIHIVRPKKYPWGYNGLPTIFGEFNPKNMDYLGNEPDFVHIALLQMGGHPKSFNIERCGQSQKECVRTARKDRILVTRSAPNEPLYKSDNMIVIDFNDLTQAMSFSKFWVPTFQPLLFEENYKGYNIFTYGGKYYGFDKSVRSINLKQIKASDCKCLKEDSEKSLKTLIDGGGKYPILSASSVLYHPHGPEKLLLASSPVWHAQSPPQYPEWVKIKFGEPKRITKLKIKAQGNERRPLVFKRAPKNFIFQGSHDGKTWKDIQKVSDANFSLKKTWLEWSFVNKEAFPYYRLYITANGGDKGILGIVQLALEEDSKDALKTPVDGDWKYPILSASSVFLSGHGPEKLLQASRFVWHAQSHPQYPEWVEIKFPVPKKITKIKIKAQGSKRMPLFKRAPKNFIFQGSHDRKTWKDLVEVKGALFSGDKPWLEWSFVNKEAFPYYRLFITANGGEKGYLTIDQLALY